MSVFRADVLKGRRALVTGGGSGICKGIAAMLAAHGASVAVMGRQQDKLDATVAELKATGAKAVAVAGDVRQPEQVEAAVARTVEALGGLDLLVNGAAGNFLCPVAQLSYNGFRTVVEIDLLGTYNLSKASFEHLMAAKGCVVNISATLHYVGTPMQSHVSAAKAGIDALTRNLALEWGPMGIRTNGIAPGPIGDTEGMRRLAPGEIGEKMANDVPLKRFGRIDEIGQAAVFLASEGASYVNGAILVVDGGRWLNNGFMPS